MDVSVWWIVIAASVGLCAGIVLFAVLTMASDHDAEVFPDVQAPMQN
jgi:predicted secreted protein